MLLRWPIPVLHFVRTTVQKYFSCNPPLPSPSLPLLDRSASQCQWLDANTCRLSCKSHLDYLLETAVVHWPVLWFVGFLKITLCLLLNEYVSFSSWRHQVDGKKVEQIPSRHLSQLMPQGAWVVSGGWRIAAWQWLIEETQTPWVVYMKPFIVASICVYIPFLHYTSNIAK